MAGMYGCFKGQSSDGAAMASGPPDSTNQEPAEVQEESSGKKKSKFQTFKKFFTRKKRKEPSAAGAEAGLKASQSSDNVSRTSENNTLTRSEKEKGSGSKISLGGKALSHDSVFVSDSSEANEALGASQDSIHGKVKSLQLQLKQAMKLGSPPSLMCVKKTDDAGAMSEDDGLPCSPPECSTPHTPMNRNQMKNSNSLLDSDDDQLSCAASSRAVSPLVVPGDFSQAASPFSCLDNSAAKHKLGLRQKACNRRKPASRLEWKTDRDSPLEEMLTVSVDGTETETLEEQNREQTEDANIDQVKPQLEEDEDEEEEDIGHAPDSTLSLLRDKEKGEEGEDESEAEQDVSHGPDTSCPPGLSLSEDEGSDHRPLPSSSSRTSSVDTSRVTPEPPAGPSEHVIGSPDQNHAECDSASEEEDEEEESSFLQEVLSSLKTPLDSRSLDVETKDVVVEMKEDKREKEEEWSVEIKEEPEAAFQSDQTSAEEEEEERPAAHASQELVNTVGEEEKSREEEAEEEKEDLVLERVSQESEEQEDEPGEVEAEEEDVLTRLSLVQERQDGGEVDEGEEDETEPKEEEPDIEREKLERREEDDDDGGEMDEQVDEVVEVEEAEEVVEVISDSQKEQIQSTSHVQEPDAAVVFEEDNIYNPEDRNDEIPAEIRDQVPTTVQEGQEHLSQNFENEREDEEEEELTEKMSAEEEGEEANQPHLDETEPDLEEGRDERTAHLDIPQHQKDPSEAGEQAPPSSQPPPLRLSDSPVLLSPGGPPSKTTVMHINLASPTSDTAPCQLSPTSADLGSSSPVADSSISTEEDEASADEGRADTVGDVEERQPTREREDSSDGGVDQAAARSPDQSKVRFTIAPAWQRSQSSTSPSSPPACISPPKEEEEKEEEEAETTKDELVEEEPALLEGVSSPGGGVDEESTAGSVTPVPKRPPSSANPVEGAVIVEGNPDNPFGVRLRKTSALLRFSSEEETQEPSVESQTRLSSSKVDTAVPLSLKAPPGCPPVSSKPALPKKPEVHGDAAGKPKCLSETAGGRGPPSWISVAKQKQKIYKENSLDEMSVKKEEQDRKSSLPTYVSAATGREQSGRTVESSSNVAQVEINKPSVSAQREPRRTLPPPTPVPPQSSKSHTLPCPIAPKPQLPPATSKPSPQPNPPQRSLSPPTPVPVPSKAPPVLSKTATTSPKTPPITSPPFSSKTSLDKVGPRGPGLSGQPVSPQRGLSPPALPQDEPPWMALAKKKAKAWSEMPQIVQ